MSKKITQLSGKQKILIYETTAPLLEAMYKEIQELSKKKPDGTINIAKIKIINRLLYDIKILLNDEPDSKYLDLLDDDSLPQYSDVVLMLSQFNASVNKFYEKYYGFDSNKRINRWFLE